MASLSPYASAVATVLAALIAGLITFLVAVFTKESKVSEFRQAWIEELRNDAAKFIGVWYYVTSELELITDTSIFASRDFWRSMKDEFLELEVLQARIELRLNPRENQKLIEQVRFLASGETLTGLPFDQRKREIDHFSAQIQDVLRSEWSRVKKGEDTYRTIRQASSFIAWVAALVLFAVFMYAVARVLGFAP